ncbi:hypothetical protein BD324DRAFT_629165 [Kockovaella imperatae]|uniref:Uncharacterized protein n=1 Tax=Kockovaella imperatae TaxID=4999 RepID=A0A1Y1UG75_9TREE|nr:hypothetical protein BD324DRAFT_629165 [Kockovaella imperatae]ORX36514.1 hypothetical protein BD324DRAFT_629165 [Kockovaella imperatae]
MSSCCSSYTDPLDRMDGQDNVQPKIDRYIGVAKSFRRWPGNNLPKTLYTKDPRTNILIPSDVAFQHDVFEEEQSLLRGFNKHQLKRRTNKPKHRELDIRNPQDGALEPLRNGAGRPLIPIQHLDDPGTTISMTSASPSSPASTLGFGPTLPPSDPTTSVVGISVACIFVGSVIIILSIWAIYRRQTSPTTAVPASPGPIQKEHDVERGQYSEFDPETPTAPGRTASIPRGTPRMSAFSHLVTISMFKPNWGHHSSNLQTPKQELLPQRRSGFVHLASPDQAVLSPYSSPVAMFEYSSPDQTVSPARSITWQASIEPDTPGRRVHFSPRSPVASLQSVAILEMIEEEEDSNPSSAESSSTIVEASRQRTRPFSSDTIMSSVTRSSAYTTASARSSVSDLATLSTISCLSSFPETPRTSTDIQMDQSSPSKEECRPERRGRSRSQILASVKHVGLRTAVGKTMSLQPTRQELEALEKIQMDDNREVLEALRALKALEDLDEMEGSSKPRDPVVVEHVEEPLKSALAEMSANAGSSLGRANTVPAKIFSRILAEECRPVRPSEVLQGARFGQGLRIHSLDDIPRFDQTFPISPIESEETEYRMDLGIPTVDETNSPITGWCENDTEAYYVGDDGNFEFGYLEDEDVLSSPTLPHIRVTSH